MNSFRLRPSFFVPFVAFSSAVFAADPEPVPLPAQVPGSTLEALKPGEVIPTEIIPEYRTSLSFSLRKVKSGPVVRFGNLGTIPQNINIRQSDGTTRFYNNGTVFADALTAEEKDANGNKIIASTPESAVVNAAGTKTYVDASGVHVLQPGELTVNDKTYTDVEIKRFRPYEAGKLRTWSFRADSQLKPGEPDQITLSWYGAVSEGATAETVSKGGDGIDVQLEYRLGRLGKHWEYGVSGGASLTSFSAVENRVILVTLLKTTDTYQILDAGDRLPADYPKDGDNAEQYGFLGTVWTKITTDSNGTAKKDVKDQTKSLRLQQAMLGMEQDFSGAPAFVEGEWRFKGAYLTARLGPALRYRFNEKYAVSFNAGLAVSLVGATFRAKETLVPVDNNATLVRVDEDKTTQGVKFGYYADVNAEYWLTERTGFQFGMGVQELGKFKQKAHRGRTAEMDLGSSRTWKLGMITRF